MLLPKGVCLRGSAPDPAGGLNALPVGKRWVSPLQRATQNCRPQGPGTHDPPLITTDMRDTRHTFPTVDWFLISYAIHCNQIPTILLADLENTGYHRQCYLRYTGNLIRLEDGTKLLSLTPRRRHSTPKSSSARSNLTIFAPEGIFCEKIEKKCGDR